MRVELDSEALKEATKAELRIEAPKTAAEARDYVIKIAMALAGAYTSAIVEAAQHPGAMRELVPILRAQMGICKIDTYLQKQVEKEKEKEGRERLEETFAEEEEVKRAICAATPRAIADEIINVLRPGLTPVRRRTAEKYLKKYLNQWRADIVTQVRDGGERRVPYDSRTSGSGLSEDEYLPLPEVAR